MKIDITELFCNIDDFCSQVDMIEKAKSIGLQRRPTRKPRLENSEIVTILLLFHRSPCKNFKYFFESYLQLYRSDFPKLVVYHRFLELIPRVFLYFILLLYALLDKE